MHCSAMLEAGIALALIFNQFKNIYSNGKKRLKVFSLFIKKKVTFIIFIWTKSDQS